MIRSMTGFGAGHALEGGEEIDAEVRSVNHKFCEVKVRLPRELAALEIEVVRTVKERLARGGVEIVLRRGQSRGALAPRIDLPLAEAYARSFEALRERLGSPDRVRLADVLAAEGVVTVEERAVDLDAARAAVRKALDAALVALTAMRGREGEALARDLEGRLDLVTALVLEVETLAPQSIEQYRVRLTERIAELARGYTLDPARLAQEVAIFADRTDVAEEVTRLKSHMDQTRALLRGSEPAGRKAEFLVQEMNREVNTIGSKAQSAEIAGRVVALKAEIERMREQVQNVE
ncbi:MAG TPA: YicC/YloC family endoribonuclease [Anaeromyxobacteraceae bacterium]|nr:YicC/YloC family endoribonuclease [Anaeromyxobacteraceae bacterium]